MKTAAIEAGARAHYDRLQAQRRDGGRKGPDGRPWQWGDLLPEDQRGLCAFVAPIVTAALSVDAAQMQMEVSA